MRITKVTIQSEDNRFVEVEIVAVEGGARVDRIDPNGRTVIGSIAADDESEARRLLAVKACESIYGIRKGEVNATGSMIYSVRCEIERIAGC